MCSDQPIFSMDSQVRLVLTSPLTILASFFESKHCDAFVFTYDTKRILKYFSGSLVNLCGIPKSSLENLSFNDLLTSHPWNQTIREENEFLLDPGECYHTLSEIGYGEFHTTVALRRQIVVVGGETVGILCVGWKLEDSRIQSAEGIVSYALGMSESSLLERWNKLTPSEIQVIEGVSQGHMNKTIAKNLSLSMRTVEARRSRMMKKLGITSVPELVRFHLLVKQAMDHRSGNS
jgi:DNA-binding CsgD family transcriptional regulator